MEIGRNYEALRLLGDAQLTLTALREAMLKLDLAPRQAARAEVAAQIAAAITDWRRLIAGVTTRDGGPVRPERVMAELEQRLEHSAIVCSDASYSSNWIITYLTAKRAGQRFLTPRGLAGLGWGLPLAIGAQVAAPDARVVCVCGDGGFGHAWAELETLRRLQLPLTLIVLNNGILGFQKHAEDALLGEHTIACDFADVDHAAIARACGVRAVRVERGQDVGPALDAAFASNQPNLIEVLTDPSAKPPLTSSALTPKRSPSPARRVVARCWCGCRPSASAAATFMPMNGPTATSS